MVNWVSPDECFGYHQVNGLTSLVQIYLSEQLKTLLKYHVDVVVYLAIVCNLLLHYSSVG